MKQLAEMWGWKIDALYRLVHHDDPTKRIPWTRIGGKVCFNEEEVEAWLARQSTEPTTPKRPQSAEEFDAAFARKHGLDERRVN